MCNVPETLGIQVRSASMAGFALYRRLIPDDGRFLP